jgi:RimJ/RimL family protein N-acetyltransferase
MPNLYPTLSNHKVILRPLQLEDEVLLQHIANEESSWRYGLTNLSLPGELNKYITAALADRDAGTCAVWTIIDAQTGRVAGTTRIGEIDLKHSRGQIGWTWIGKDFQGTGLNRAMKYEILKYGFEQLGLHRLELKADERNIRSRKAILGIGATEEGTLREHMKLHNGFMRSSVYYSVLKREWPAVRQKYFTAYS